MAEGPGTEKGMLDDDAVANMAVTFRWCPKSLAREGGMISVARRAGFFSIVWLAVAFFLVLSQAISAAVVGRYGQWVYTTAGERMMLHGLMATAGVLVGIVAGCALWLAFFCVGFVADHTHRRWLCVGAALTTSAWLAAMFARKPLHVYGNPLWVSIIALSFLFLLACARGRRPWLIADVVTMHLSFLALLAIGSWLNLVFIRQAESSVSSVLNAAVLLGTGALAVVGLLLASRATISEVALAAPGHWSRPVVRLSVLFGVAVLAILGTFPLYRLTVAASFAAPPTMVAAKHGRFSQAGEKLIPPSLLAKNLILISIDTLRADHLGILGYERATSPKIDRFFANGVVFTQAYSQTPWTLPSHVSMLTGQYPSTHGVRIYPTVTRGYVDRIPTDVVMISEIVSAAGFETAGFTGGGYLSREYGFDRGFDTFGEAESRRMFEVLDMALPWLRNNANERFFLFLHAFDVHRYNPPHLCEDFTDGGYQGPLLRIREERPAAMENLAVGDGFYSLEESDLGFLKSLYDSEIRNVDEQLERLFVELEQLGLLSSTAVILTSDHGENFYEHGTTGHAFNLYGPVLHVPLLVRSVGAPGHVVGQRVQTIDLAPTVLDLLGLAVPDDTVMQGDSLVPALVGTPLQERPIICEADVLDTQACFYSGRYKYINYGILSHSLFDPRLLVLSFKGLLSPYAKTEELFDVESDPNERHNLATADPERTAEYRSILMQSIRALRKAPDEHDFSKRPPMSPELKEQLRSLGYVE